MGHLPLLLADAKAPRIIGCTCGWANAPRRHDSMTRSRDARRIGENSRPSTRLDRDRPHDGSSSAISRRRPSPGSWPTASAKIAATLARLEDESIVRLPKGTDSERIRPRAGWASSRSEKTGFIGDANSAQTV